MLRRMSVRKYVSMSRERKYDIPVDAKDFLTCDGTAESELRQKLKISPDDFKALSDYLRVSHHDELNQSNRSVFEAGTPGVITLPDLARMVDLNAWGVRLGRMTVTLEVRIHHRERDPVQLAKAFAADDVVLATDRIWSAGTRAIHRTPPASRGSRPSWRRVLGRIWSAEPCFSFTR